MGLFNEMVVLCPKCNNQNKVKTDNFKRLEIQKCENCGDDYLMYDVIDSYISLYPYLQTGIRIISEYIINNVSISCKDEFNGVIDDVNIRMDINSLVKTLLIQTIKYGNSYVRTKTDNNTIIGFEILDPKITRIKSDYGKNHPNQHTLSLIPLSYYDVNGSWEYDPKEIGHFTDTMGKIFLDNLYGLPNIYPLLRALTYHKITGLDHFFEEIKIGYRVNNFLIEKYDVIPIQYALSEVKTLKSNIKMIVNDIVSYIQTVLISFYGDDAGISINVAYYSTDDILRNTGYKSEINEYRTKIYQTYKSGYGMLLNSGLITKEEYEEMISKYKP